MTIQTTTVTKSDLLALEKKQNRRFSDLKNQTQAIRKDSLRLEERVEKLEDLTKTILFELKKNTNILIDLTGKFDDLRNENTVGANQIYEVRKQITDHDKRIKKLEKN
jgi:hypothetical protein